MAALVEPPLRAPEAAAVASAIHYEVVAPKGALLRAKADKASEMLGTLPLGTRVVVDRTLKLAACGTKRARLVAPIEGLPHAWSDLINRCSARPSHRLHFAQRLVEKFNRARFNFRFCLFLSFSSHVCHLIFPLSFQLLNLHICVVFITFCLVFFCL